MKEAGARIVAGDVREARRAITRGAMLYDASLGGHADDRWFDRDRWGERGSSERQAGGRGTVIFLRDDARRWVLRHYRRGGSVARLLDDRYLYSGEDRTRSFREWRLLRELSTLGLPAPRPVAARYRRYAVFYRADLLTVELPSRLTLARALASERTEWKPSSPFSWSLTARARELAGDTDGAGAARIKATAAREKGRRAA